MQKQPALLLETLEPRLLMSADPLTAAFAEAGVEATLEPAHGTADALAALLKDARDPNALSLVDEISVDRESNNTAVLRTEVVFIDSAVENHHVLVAGLLEDPTRELTVFMLKPGTNGLEQISQALQGFADLDAVHIVSHGSDGTLELGDARVDRAMLGAAKDMVGAWSDALSADADLLIYGCDLAAGSDGRGFASTLADLTGADVAASTDLTGHAAMAGDWDLEYRLGSIESSLVLDAAGTDAWHAVLAAPTADGAETRLNSNTTGTQNGVDIGMYADGDYVAVWQSDDGGANGAEIVFKRFSADGTPKDASEVSVHTPAVSAETLPSVTTAGNGNFVVTWVTDAGGDDAIQAAVFNAAGTVVGGPLLVNSGTGFNTGDQTAPDVAADASGNFVVTWHGDGPGGAGVYAKQFNADGTPKAAGEFLVSATSRSDGAAVAMNASGAFVIGYTDNSDDIGAVLYDAGGTVESSFKVAESNKELSNSSVGMRADGGFVVVWEQKQSEPNRNVFHLLFDASGTAIDTDGTLDGNANEVRVNASAGQAQTAPTVAMNANGAYVVAWQSDANSTNEIEAREYDASGTPRDASNFAINTSSDDSQVAPAIGISVGNNFIVAWSGAGTQTGQEDTSGVFAQRATSAEVDVAPTLVLANTVTSVGEDLATGSRVKVADINITDDGEGTNVLALTGTDASLFEIDGTELFIKSGTVLDFETNNTLDVTVTVDGVGVGVDPDDSKALSISVTDVNEAPSLALQNTVTNIAENATTAPRVKVADIVITDDALGTETLSLSGADASLFEIDGTELFIKGGTTLDFETNPALDVTVAVDDAAIAGTPEDSAALNIVVGDVNEAPAVTLNNTVATLPEDTSTVARIKIADVVVTDDALGSESLALAGTDAALFEIDGSELFLKAGTALDFETQSALNVTVTVDDATIGANPDSSIAHTVNVSDVNEVPSVALQNTVTNLAENTDTAARIKVADIVVSDDALGTETLSLAGADAALFEIDGTGLFLKAGTALDFETDAALDVAVAVDDSTVGGNPDATAALTVSLSDVNEAPQVSLSNQVTNLAESVATSPRIKVADIVVNDDALGAETLSLAGADAALFEIDGTSLFLKDSTVLNATTNPVLDVTVRVDDVAVGGTPDDSVALSIGITDVNDAPTVALANTVTSLAEDAATSPRVKVADINITDDVPGTNQLALTGADAALFEIDAGVLFLKDGTTLDFETKPALTVTVTVDDAAIGSGVEDSVQLTINVTDVNEAPSVALANTVTSLSESTDTAARIKVADITVSDDALGAETLTVTGADAAAFEIDGAELFLKAGTALDFESKTSFQVSVAVDDATIAGTPDDSAALTLNIVDANEVPSVALANTVTSLSESTSTVTRVKVADIVITDDALGTEVLAVAGADAALFEIDGTALFLKAGVALDFETDTALAVDVTVDDSTVGANPDSIASLAISITDANEAPSVVLANTVTNLAEDAATSPRLKVADVVVTDDALGSESLSLSGADAALFEIDGAELFLKNNATLDFESNPSLDVDVLVDDVTLGAGADAQASLAVAVSDVNESPTITLQNATTSLSTNTSTVTRVAIADLVVADDALGTSKVTLSGTDAALFEVDGNQLFLKAGVVLDPGVNPALDLNINVSDPGIGGGPVDTQALQVAVVTPTVTVPVVEPPPEEEILVFAPPAPVEEPDVLADATDEEEEAEQEQADGDADEESASDEQSALESDAEAAAAAVFAQTDGEVVLVLDNDGDIDELTATTTNENPEQQQRTGPATIGGYQAGNLLRTAFFELLETVADDSPTQSVFSANGDAGAMDPQVLTTLAEFVDGLDSVRDDVDADLTLVRTILSSGAIASAGLSAGYIVWLARGGVLLSSLMAAMPAWQFIDPLPVLSSTLPQSDDGDESLESLVDRAPPPAAPTA